MILVTGATGANGTELLKRLSPLGHKVRAMVRAPRKAEALRELPGIELLHGVTRAFLVTPSTERAEAQQIGFIETARHAGVDHIVILSQYAAADPSPVRFLRYHAAVEHAARQSGLAWTFLRPNLFMQGLLHFKDMIRATSSFAAAIGDARVSVVDVRDIAAAACAALTSDDHAGRIYNLTGPEALTHGQMAQKLSQAVGRPITFHDVPESQMADAMRHVGMPDWQVEGLLEDYAHYRRNEAAAVETGVLQATGAAARAFDDFARDNAAMFQNQG
jgi:uncharacterized protein YbjT (DUF2867 family)